MSKSAAALIVALASSARAGAPNQSVDLAISRVYPALVQIHVVAVDHSGGRERKHEASGSGIVISSDGYVVTNHHVAGKAAALKVTLSSREQLDAELVGTDAFADISVLKLDLAHRAKGAPPLPAAKFGASAALRVGDVVLAMGCPLALSHSVTQGIVANKDMMLPRRLARAMVLDGEDVGALVKWIGHDAAIAPGNSGGPLVNLAGEVVGINEVGLGPISGAIPSELARAVAEQIIAHGKVTRSFVGAEFQPLLSRQLDQDPAARGVLVSSVVPGSSADAAGLTAGDVIVQVDGENVSARFREELPAFHLLLLGKKIGQPVQFRVKRGVDLVSLSVKTEPRTDAAGKVIEAKEWGLAVEPITPLKARELQRPDARGVLVNSVRSGGPADRAQPALQPGDVIEEVGGQPVATVEAFTERTKALGEGKTAPQPTVVAFARRTEALLTVVEVGIRPPPEPPHEARKAWLPVATQVLTRKLATALGLKGKRGVRVTEVFPQSSAEAAGFKVGDVITQVDGVLVEASEPHDQEVFEGMVRGYKLGARAEFTVLRDKQPLQLHAVLDEGPTPEREMKIYEDAQLEFHARDASVFDRVRRHWGDKDSGVIVTQVEGGGWAAVGGLQPDDEIRQVDGKPAADVGALKAQLESARAERARRVVLQVKRGAYTHFLELEPKWK